MRASIFVGFGLLGLAGLVSACGTAPPPAPAPGASTATPAPASGDAGAAPAPAAKAVPSIELHREPFMQLCTKKVPAPDYCDCAWSEFKSIFKAEDLAKELPTEDPRFAKLQDQTATNCGSKLPEATLRQVYIDGCSKNDKKRLPHCECEWTAMRKKLALADFVRLEAQAASPRLMEARSAIPKECKGKLPKELVRTDFVAGCSQGDAGRTKVCECAWKKVSAKYSAEEIHVGIADLQKVPGLEECKAAAQ